MQTSHWENGFDPIKVVSLFANTWSDLNLHSNWRFDKGCYLNFNMDMARSLKETEEIKHFL